MGWLLSTSLVSGNTAVLERRRADTRLLSPKPQKQGLPPPFPSCLRRSSLTTSIFPPDSSTWCPASPCPRTCPRRRPPTYLRHPPRPRHPSHPWPPCPRCRRYWEEPTCPAWEPCAGATQTNTPCRSRQVGPTTQHCTLHTTHTDRHTQTLLSQCRQFTVFALTGFQITYFR